jgi:hypothetical protein
MAIGAMFMAIIAINDGSKPPGFFGVAGAGASA